MTKKYLEENKIELIIVCIMCIVILVIGIVILAIPLDTFVLDNDSKIKVLDENFYYENTHVFEVMAYANLKTYKTFLILDYIIVGASGVAMTCLMLTLCSKRVQILALLLSIFPSLSNFIENILSSRAMALFPQYNDNLSSVLSAFTTIKWCSFIIWGLGLIGLIVQAIIRNSKVSK